MSVEAWTTTFVIISFIIYLYIGWRSRVRDSKGFFVADRGIPAIANGAATAADWMSAASFISMAGLISFLGVKFYTMKPWFLGISPEGIGTVGMVINFVVTYFVSRLTPPPPLAVQELVDSLRSPDTEVLPLEDLGEEQLD
jgi:Na+(H+)/acetate symporter ActP